MIGTDSFWPPRPTAAPAPEARSTSSSRAQLSLVLLLYFLGGVAVITLAPFDFILPSAVRVAADGDWRDLGNSFFLFIPLGFLYPLTRRGEQLSPWWVLPPAALLGMGLAMMRLFETAATFSPLGLALNVAGAGVGALLLRAANERLRLSARLAGRLSLEIPLMGLIYLLVPLLVVSSLTALDEPLHIIALLPLGLLGARLLSAVHEHHFGPAHVFRVGEMAVIAGGWAIVGTFPVLLSHPVVGGALALLVGLATLYDSSRAAIHGAERRFEADVLRSAVPYVAAYLLALLLLPLTQGANPWHFVLALPDPDGDNTRLSIRLLESATAFTILGYMLAEARGRSELPFRRIARRVLIECAIVAAALQTTRAFAVDAGASGLEALLMAGAGVVGAGLYYKQRQRVRWILIHGAPRPSAVRERAVAGTDLVVADRRVYSH